MDHRTRLDALRALQRALDEAFRLPGTRLRFGWDPVIGLIPWAGDAITALMAGAMVLHAHRLRVPKVVQLRMLLNVGIDLLVGIVPFAGDVADVFWKSNTKNMALLERHAAQPVPATSGDWLFVSGVIGAIALMAGLPLLVVYWIVSQIVR